MKINVEIHIKNYEQYNNNMDIVFSINLKKKLWSELKTY